MDLENKMQSTLLPVTRKWKENYSLISLYVHYFVLKNRKLVHTTFLNILSYSRGTGLKL